MSGIAVTQHDGQTASCTLGSAREFHMIARAVQYQKAAAKERRAQAAAMLSFAYYSSFSASLSAKDENVYTCSVAGRGEPQCTSSNSCTFW